MVADLLHFGFVFLYLANGVVLGMIICVVWRFCCLNLLLDDVFVDLVALVGFVICEVFVLGS